MVFYRSSPAPPNHPSVVTQGSCWVEALPQAAASGREIMLILSHHPRGHEQVLERGEGSSHGRSSHASYPTRIPGGLPTLRANC